MTSSARADVHVRRVPLALWTITGLFAAGYSLYGLFRHWHFRSSAYDLGIFDQAVWHLSRFELPVSSITGHANLFADHFHPILLVLVPLYWIWSGPESLIVAQAVLLAASFVPVFLYSRTRVGATPALWLTASYGFFWPMQRTMAFDFHEMAFAPLLLATAILALETSRWTWFWAAALMLCGVKEESIPMLGMFGLRLILLGHVRQGVAAIAVSIFGFAAVMGVVLPYLSQGAAYPYWGSHREALSGGVLSALMQFVTPIGKLRTVAMWGIPFALLPLRSPLVLLALPIAASRLLSDSINHWGTNHYSVPLAPILAMAAADGLARLTVDWPSSVRTAAYRFLPVATLVFCAILPGRLPLWRVLAPSHYRTTMADRTGYQALTLIPQDASVAAQHSVLPHLSQRAGVYGLESDPPETAFVIATSERSVWPHRDFEEIRALLNQRTTRGYRVVFERDGWIVLALKPDTTGIKVQ